MILYDSTSYLDIPTTAQAVAYYCDGLYATTEAAVRTRFPTQPLVRIAVFGQTNDGNALDVERGDATPDEAPQWVQWRHAAGIPQPWVYVNRSNRSTVENALTMAGILTDQVALWVATLDGTQTVPAGPYPVAAVQYANSIASGGHYDLSLVNQTFGPGGGTIGVNLAMAEIVTGDNHDGRVYVTDWMIKRYISDPNALPGWYGNPSSVFPTVTAPRVVPSGVLGEVPDQSAATGGGPEPKSVTGTFTGTLA